jgi:predicted GNAT family acetyltransferase
MYHLQTYADPREFRDAIYPFLLGNEAENCLGIGLVDTLITKPDRYPDFVLARILDEVNDTVGALWITPPQPLGITALSADAVPAVVAFAKRMVRTPTGVFGPNGPAKAFKELWMEDQGIQPEVRVVRQGIYELSERPHFTTPTGVMRLAEERDCSLLESWSYQFAVDCGMVADRELAKLQAAFAIQYKLRYLWEVDGMPVSMAGISGNTPNGIRINFVYTPPERRGNEFATALVACLSALQFDRGKRFCFLFADLDNSTSNAIYQRIGYRQVSTSFLYDWSA